MQVIPVLDLLDGHVVRAVRGERGAYRPIRSCVAHGSEPLAVARALLEASGARTLYIADLGAILERGAHVSALAALRAGLPGVELWLDAGFGDYTSMRALFERIDALGPISGQHNNQSSGQHNGEHISHHDSQLSAQIDSLSTAHRSKPNTRRSASRTADTQPATLVPVFGTESLRDPSALRDAHAAGLAPILSLDHRAGALLTATELDRSPTWWPSRVIAMTLDQVGSYAGPDLATFERIRTCAPAQTTLIGAGGIRDRADLSLAASTGAAAWLVASALHDRKLDAA